MEIVHTPVLLSETLKYLSPKGENYENGGLMIDSTLGEGGHSNAFLKQFSDLHIVGLDRDAEIQARAKERLSPFCDRMKFYNVWFNDFYANYPDILPRPDIILFDLGISVFHYEKSKRGFSFRYDEELDMRLDSKGQSAKDIINTIREQDLADLIFRYSEERYSRRIAKAIVNARQISPVTSSKELAEIIYRAVPSDYRHGAIHPATKTFQALRIAVNSELKRLDDGLVSAFDILKPGGKMGVITFHSLEDRIVKNFFRNLAKNCSCPPEQPICTCGGTPRAKLLTKKPVVPSEEEIKQNSPSRSAKLRVIQKIQERQGKTIL